MKKAKEYAVEYISAGRSAEALGSILRQMFLETGELIKLRRAVEDDARFAVFNEIDDKFRSFSREVGDVRLDGFAIALRKLYPDIYFFWIQRFPGRTPKPNTVAKPLAPTSVVQEH